MKLYHYTCLHSEPDIRREGRLIPWSQPMLDGLHLIWLTDMAWPDREGLGLTSLTLQCDRAQWRVTVDAQPQRWVDFARTLPTKLRPARRALEFAPGALPMHWWVSEVGLPALAIERVAELAVTT